MKQIGGEKSELFSLRAAELASFRERVAAGQLEPPVAIHPEGPTGGLVRFRSLDEAMLVKLAIV